MSSRTMEVMELVPLLQSIRNDRAELEKTRAWDGRIIIGIDFGSQYTSAAFARIESPGEVVEEQTFTKWPNYNSWAPKAKIPTVVYYSEDGNVVGWGLETPKPVYLHGEPGGIRSFEKFKGQKVERFKHRLSWTASSPLPTSSDFSPIPEGKTATHVVADFLEQLRKSILDQLQEILGEEFVPELANLQYCFTYSAAWTQTTQSALRTAIVQAGYVKSNDDADCLWFMPESLATVTFCTKRSLLKLEPRDVVLAINSSSSICDSISYQVENLESCTFTQYTPPVENPFGSRTLNSNFDTIIKAECNKFKSPNGWKSKLVQRVYKTSVEEFELRIRKEFDNDGRTWGVDIAVDAYFSEPLVDEGCLILKDERILECFKPVLEKLMEMVESQIEEIKRKGGALKAIVISGEFANSKYLFSNINLAFPTCQVVRPADEEAARAKGAVIACISKPISLGSASCTLSP